MLSRPDGSPNFEGARSRLTRRERDVLGISSRGASVREVADELGVPVSDVRGALASAMLKLGAHSKLEAVILALRRGEIYS
jgi:DNA-binding CsgD family transcriptional regulator